MNAAERPVGAPSNPNTERVRIISEALPYIQRFRGAVFVVKFGGSAMEDPRLVQNLLRDVVLLEAVGIDPVLVHGGGKAISAAMAEAGLEPVFVRGLRVTDDAAIRIVERVLNNEINAEIVRTLVAQGGRASGLRGQDVFAARRQEAQPLPGGGTTDLGLVGEVKGVNAAPVRRELGSESVPVLSPLGRDEVGGGLLNINADLAAAALAVELQAAKLIYLSDVLGICHDPADPATLVPTVSRASSRALIDSGVVSGGMLPKLASALDALDAGVGKVHMIDGRMPHSLLLEILTDSGVGTEIVRERES